MNVFITGTATDCGKTWVTAGLLRAAGARGLTSLGMKPVASGATEIDGHWINDDVMQLRSASNVTVPASDDNPYLFELPASPHIAALGSERRVDLEVIADAYTRCATAAEVVIVEGVGGWLVPLNEHHNVADLAFKLQLPVVLVVGLRLGCINHALLSAAAIEASGMRCCGWIANGLDSELLAREAVIETLVQQLKAPLLAVTSRGDDSALAAALDALLSSNQG